MGADFERESGKDRWHRYLRDQSLAPEPMPSDIRGLYPPSGLSFTGPLTFVPRQTLVTMIISARGNSSERSFGLHWFPSGDTVDVRPARIDIQKRLVDVFLDVMLPIRS